MSWFSKKSESSDLENAEAYMESGSGALYRHYSLRGVQDILSGKVGNQGNIADLSDDEAADLIQRVRSKRGMGPRCLD